MAQPFLPCFIQQPLISLVWNFLGKLVGRSHLNLSYFLKWSASGVFFHTLEIVVQVRTNMKAKCASAL